MTGFFIVTLTITLMLAFTSTEAVKPTVDTFGYCYAPYRDGQSPNYGSQVSYNDILEDMNILKNITKYLRLYGMGQNTNRILRAAKVVGMKLYLQAWIGKEDTPEKIQLNEYQITELIRAANNVEYNGVIAALIVGSETLYRHDVNESRLIGMVNTVKRETLGTNLKVTVGNIIWSTALGRAVDFIFFHIHPLWENLPVANSAARVTQEIRAKKQTFQNKDVQIGETGWATGGGNKGSAVPNDKNQYIFLTDLIEEMNKHKDVYDSRVKVFIFSAFDEQWKGLQNLDPDHGGEGEIGAYWGIFTSNRDTNKRLKISSRKLYYENDKPPQNNNSNSNALTNSYFNDGLAPWNARFYNAPWAGYAAGKGQVVNNELVLEIDNVGNVWYSIQLIQSGLKLETGAYTLSIQITSTISRQIVLSLENMAANNNPTIIEQTTVNATEEKQVINHYFSIAKAKVNAKLVVGFGSINTSSLGVHTVHIGYIVLQKTII